MNSNPMHVAPEDTMRTAKNIMKENGLSGLPVVDGARLAGILSLYDIMACYDNGSMDDKVSKYMSRDVILLEEDMPISFAINYFNKFKFRRFPVMTSSATAAVTTYGSSIIRTITARSFGKTFSTLRCSAVIWPGGGLS